MNKIKKLSILLIFLAVLLNGKTDENQGAIIPRAVEPACLDRRPVAVRVK